MASSRRHDLQIAHENANPRLFTVPEACRTLPLVRKIIADVVRTWHQFNHPDQRPVPAQDLEQVRAKYKGRLEKLLAELLEIGCQLKDWRLGLVDFLTLYQGRQVELCWKHGEETITAWHEMNAGFPGRQLITPEFEAQVEREVSSARSAAHGAESLV